MQVDEEDLSSSIMTTEYVDLSDYCRLCLQLPGETQTLNLDLIYDEEEQLTYYDCFVICTQIDLRADGINKPQQLCKSCGLELQVAYDFHKKVEESKKFLMQLDKSENPRVESLETKFETEEISHEEEQVESVPQSATEKIDNDIAIEEADTAEHLEIPVEYEEIEEHIDIEEYQSIEELADEEQMDCFLTKEIDSDPDEISSLLANSNLNRQSHQRHDINASIQCNSTNALGSVKHTTPTASSATDDIDEEKCQKFKNEIFDKQAANRKQPAKINHTQRAKHICCDYCSKTFPSRSKMLWHRRMHEPDRPRFNCPSEDCDRTYLSRQSCELHYKQMHCSLDEFQPLECMLCHKKFAIPQTLEVHMRYHTRQFPFECPHCERRFGQKGHLTSHMQVKHNNLRYICPEEGCEKVFKNTISLRNHSFSHTGMPFRCIYCDRGYPQKSKLKVHLKVKHEIVMTLEEMESMRMLKSARTRHYFVKLDNPESSGAVDTQTAEVSLSSGSVNEYFVNVPEETASDVIVA